MIIPNPQRNANTNFKKGTPTIYNTSGIKYIVAIIISENHMPTLPNSFGAPKSDNGVRVAKTINKQNRKSDKTDQVAIFLF